MRNVKQRFYKFYRYVENDYGQLTLNPEAEGEVKIAIYTTSQSIQDNINYQGASYIGLTYASLLDDTTAIEYENRKLKVLYVNSMGRLKQVFFAEI